MNETKENEIFILKGKDLVIAQTFNIVCGIVYGETNRGIYFKNILLKIIDEKLLQNIYNKQSIGHVVFTLF